MPEARTPKREHLWASWLPLALLPSVALFLRNRVTAWEFMWALAFAIFAGLKWFTWWSAKTRVSHTPWRSAAYLLMWPGMDADSFLDAKPRAEKPKARQWFAAFLKAGLGAFCLWFLARQVPSGAPLLRGWMGMLGLILLLHFGSFHVIALVWQSFGIAAEPIMRAPLRSQSLSEFWGRRWNLGFRQLSHDLIFRPTYKKLGPHGAGFLVFLVSGLLHDLVISVPARGGYGLPTLYFAIQGAGVAAERSPIGKRVGLARGLTGWMFMAIVTAVPAFWLFHPPFVRNVILPFMKAIGAL
jgi:hypothetical protein